MRDRQRTIQNNVKQKKIKTKQQKVDTTRTKAKTLEQLKSEMQTITVKDDGY